MGQSAQGGVVLMAGVSLFFIKLLGPTTLVSRLLGKQLQGTAGEFSASPSEVDYVGFTAGLGYGRRTHQGAGLGAVKSIWVAPQARQQRGSQYFTRTGKRTDPVCLRKFIQIPGDLLVASGGTFPLKAERCFWTAAAPAAAF